MSAESQSGRPPPGRRVADHPPRRGGTAGHPRSGLPRRPGNQRGRRPMSRQAPPGKTLIDVRRLAAIDMYGRHGSKRRRRLILAEFVLAAIDIPLLGLTLVQAASVPRVFLGAYLIGVGLNFVPLGLHAISLSRAGRLGTELAGVDVAAELRRYTAKHL